jgi:hypothetical protein
MAAAEVHPEPKASSIDSSNYSATLFELDKKAVVRRGRNI